MARERGYPSKGYWWSFWLAWLVPYVVVAVVVGLLLLFDRGGSDSGVVNLKAATHNTLAAPNYTEVFSENTPHGTQDEHFVYQAPDRLGGYIQTGSKRTYVYVIGKAAYESLSVASSASVHHLTLYRQNSQDAKSFDPAQIYLPYAQRAKSIHQFDSTYSFTLTQTTAKGRQSGQFDVTVAGSYISDFDLRVTNSSVHLVISQVGSSKPVGLPSGSKVATAG